VLRRNHIHHVRRSPFAGSAPNNGIFFDEGSKEFVVEGNVIHSTAQAPIRFNRSRQELHTFRDNNFGVAPDAPAFPDSAKAVVAEAGLEPAFRDIDLPVNVPPSPIHSMKPPPPPPSPPK
jgi:hypothetical protein